VFDTLDKVAVGDIRLKLRDILGAFLFRGEDIEKKVAVLSGGERSRLAMAKLILKPYNLLALDEPTNHMDIRSKDILKQALVKYDGTLVIVSHDRDFLDGLVDKVYEFRDGKIKEHLGGISAFLERRKIESLSELEIQAAENKKEVAAPKKAAPVSAPVEEKGAKLSYEEQKELRRKQKQVEICEKKIKTLEEKMKEIEGQLAMPEAGTDIDTLTRQYLELKRELDSRMEEWMMLSE
jgi:ATP-binding cassette subfamily F protein 3